MKSANPKYLEFLKVCNILNQKFEIIPVLFGSLGLEVLTSSEFHADDIDVLIPGKYLDQSWPLLQAVIEDEGFTFIDLHEHEFKKKEIKLAFAAEEELLDFADVDYKYLHVIKDEEASYKLLNLEEYLRVYTQSYQDSYRRDKNNGKDLDKIRFLEELVN